MAGICFLQDWQNYPNAIADTKTTNKSFIKMAQTYRSLGIKNYYFHLALLQPQLQGVDPYDPNLTVLQKSQILWECDNNIWYFLREIIRVKGAGETAEECMYIADRAQIAATWLMLACIDYIRIQPRQTGKSYGTNCNTLWLLYFHYQDETINLITKDEKLRQSNIKSYKDIRDEWPDYINRNTKKDDNNQVSMSCLSRNNKLFTHVAQNSEKSANNLGRGLTSPYLHFDEPPFIAFIEKTMVGALGSTGKARVRAERRGKVFCNVFTTTAGDKDDRDGKVIYQMWSDAAPFNDMMFDALNREELIRLIKTNMSGDAVTVNITMNHRQLGYDDAWLLDKIAVARGKGDDIDKDYMNLWTGGGANSVIPRHLTERVRESQRTPLRTDVSREYYMFKWYESFDPTRNYLLTVDTSDAVGKDDIGITLEDTVTGNVTGAAGINTTNLQDFAYWVADFLTKYKNVTLIIENKYNAQVIIDIIYLQLLAAGEDPFRRIFNQIVQNKDDRRTDYAEISGAKTKGRMIVDKYRREFGFFTSSELRSFMYSQTIINACEDSGHGIHDEKLINQMLSLIVKNNRVDHGPGGHDDMVISYLMGQWFLRLGRNLSYYGIDYSRVLSQINKDVEEKTVAEVYEDTQQSRYVTQIEDVYEQLKTAKDPYSIFRLEAKLQMLMGKVDRVKAGIQTYDAMIEESVRQRRNNIRMRR